MPGHRNEYGEYVEGSEERRTLYGSIQPMTLEDLDLVGGTRASGFMKLFVPADQEAAGAGFSSGFSSGFRMAGLAIDTHNPLRAASLDANTTADIARLLINGTEYDFVVIESRWWPGWFCRAVALYEQTG